MRIPLGTCYNAPRWLLQTPSAPEHLSDLGKHLGGPDTNQSESRSMHSVLLTQQCASESPGAFSTHTFLASLLEILV